MADAVTLYRSTDGHLFEKEADAEIRDDYLQILALLNDAEILPDREAEEAAEWFFKNFALRHREKPLVIPSGAYYGSP